MAAGRCAGCGQTGSVRRVRLHILDCTSYIELFQRDPGLALTPEAELSRFRREDDTPEARARRRGERLTPRFAEINRAQLAAASRWATPPDLLD